MSNSHDHAPHQHQNVWPFVTGIGIISGAFAVIPLLQGNIIGNLLLTFGLGMFLFGVVAWLTTMTREDISEAQGRSKIQFPGMGIFATWFIILSEVFLFGTLFGVYFSLRSHDASFVIDPLVKTVGDPNAHFYQVNGEVMNVFGPVVVVNTLLLVGSSFVIHFAEHFLKHGKQILFRVLLGITIVMGIFFMAGQVIEFVEFSHEGFGIFTSSYGGTFYGLTGLHGFHVTAGIILLIYLFISSFKGAYSDKSHEALKSISLYWHFVDVVWIILVLIMYLRIV